MLSFDDEDDRGILITGIVCVTIFLLICFYLSYPKICGCCINPEEAEDGIDATQEENDEHLFNFNKVGFDETEEGEADFQNENFVPIIAAEISDEDENDVETAIPIAG